MAVRSPLINDSGNVKEMSSTQVDEIVDQVVYQYSLNPSVALSVAGSGGNIGSISDTRLQAGAASTSTTAFPNEGVDKYNGLLVVRSELKSVCSHHHQPVTGTAYIGILPDQEVIGLSKYTRIAQWVARRGTLQEQLCNDITRQIQAATGTEDVAVYIGAVHGCCENRGIMAKSSLTQTTVLKGEFKNDGVKKEFFDNIKLQQELARD